MKNYIKKGESFVHVAAAAIVSGNPVVDGSFVGIAVQDAATGEDVVCMLDGVYDIVKDGATAHVRGVLLYWDDTAKKVTQTSTANKVIGRCETAAASADVTCRVLLARI